MSDRSAFHRGPAYTFQQPFNKTVVVRESDFPGSIPNTPAKKRDLGSKWLGIAADLIGLSKRQSGEDSGVDQSDFDQNLYAGPKDRPWFCFWNGTYLDGFIYVYGQAAETSTAAASAPSSPAKHKRDDGPIPRTIKIEERRDVLPSQAYCQQFQILDNWRLGPVARDDGSFNIVNIEEDESDQASTINQAKFHRGGGRLRRTVLGNRDITYEGNMCECSWTNS